MTGPEGMIQGGWIEVWTVYTVTWATLLAYGVALYLRSSNSNSGRGQQT